MGARLRDRIAQAARLTGALLTLTLAAALAGCGADLADADARATARLDQGAATVAGDLERGIAACFAAINELDSTLAEEEAGDARWAAIERTRSRHAVSGLVWTRETRESAWAGRPIEPLALPPPAPWRRSFQSDLITYHSGPFVRALVIGPVPAAGGQATATWILDEVGPDGASAPPFAARWLDPLDLYRVELVAPDAAPARGVSGECVRRVAIKGPEGKTVLAADIQVHGLYALIERIDAENASLLGIFLLIIILVGAILAVRLARPHLHHPTTRWLALSGVVIAVRGALKLLDLPGRFPPLREAFSPTEFAVETVLGWLASPGDFALSAVTYLLVVICVTYAFRHLRIPLSPLGRLMTVALAVLTSGLALAIWLRTIQVAVDGGETPFFQAHAFIPSAPPALMLFGLVAVTATTYLITHIVLRRGLRSLALALPQPVLRRAGLIVLALGTAWGMVHLLATWHWVVVPLILTAGLVVGRGEGRFAMGLPGRVLVLSVLAVAFAYPVLWERVAQREHAALGDALDRLIASTDTTKAGVAAAIADARTDPTVASALRDAAAGGRPEGIALHLWLRHASHWQRAPSEIIVLDDRRRTLDKFSLTTLPRKLLPVAAPPATGIDEEVFVSRGDADRLRSIVGRVRIRDDEDEDAVLGTVIFLVPDRMDLILRGLAGLGATHEESRPVALTAGRDPQYAILQDGVVLASSDPSLSRAPGSFGPAALTTLNEDRSRLRWDRDGHQGYARYDGERRRVFAVRREHASLGGALLALARLIVVGVGLGLIASIGCLLFSLRAFQMQLHHKILLSYFLMSVVPLVLLGVASARETQQRHDARLTERLQADLTRVRNELELLGAGVFDAADSDQLEAWAPQRRHDTLLYRDGDLEAASRTGLVDAELLSARLPASAYQATVLERRQIVRREAVYAGRAVWFGYAPILDGSGRTRATVGVPLLYDADRIEEQLTLTGSVLLAAYMLTLVLVLVGGIFAARRLTRPLGDLAAGTERVAAGDLDVELQGEGGDEIGQLVGAFNTMTHELREMTERVAAAERESAWRRMASQVAHEIKNPLTPMRLMLQQMEADLARDPKAAAESIRRMAPKVLKQIESLDRIARDFAQFARLPRRRTDEVDVGALVREVTDLYEGAKLEGITVDCEVEAAVPPVWWDEEELRRVLLNMVLNATEALEGRETGRVTLRAASEARRGQLGVLVTIADDGVGIETADAARLFEPQFSTKTRGTGLGLAIVSRVVQDLGGAIDFDSTPGEGTTFRLWWPSKPPE